MPRPSSTTVTELSGWIVTSTVVAVAGERLVDGVVDDLVDEVVQAAHAGGPDVHAGALADGLETLEDGDVLGVVCVRRAVGRRVLRHVPPNDVKNPGSGCPTPGRGASDLWTQMIADRGVSPAPTTASKVLQNRRNRRAVRGSSRPPARGDRLAAQRPHRRAAERRVQPLDQVGCHEVELLGPDGRRAGHDEDPVALAGGLRLGGDDGRPRRPPRPAAPRPAGSAARAGRRAPRSPGRPGVAGGASCRERRRPVLRDGARRHPQAHDAGRVGARDVREVRRRDHACPAAPRRSTRRSRRSASSSLMTSSRSSSGGAPRSSSSAARSASSSASSASRCSPCEP